MTFQVKCTCQIVDAGPCPCDEMSCHGTLWQIRFGPCHDVSALQARIRVLEEELTQVRNGRMVS